MPLWILVRNPPLLPQSIRGQSIHSKPNQLVLFGSFELTSKFLLLRLFFSFFWCQSSLPSLSFQLGYFFFSSFLSFCFCFLFLWWVFIVCCWFFYLSLLFCCCQISFLRFCWISLCCGLFSMKNNSWKSLIIFFFNFHL